MVPVPRELVAFLLGSDSLNGKWFGDCDHEGRKFWWRSHLREAMLAAARHAGPDAKIAAPQVEGTPSKGLPEAGHTTRADSATGSGEPPADAAPRSREELADELQILARVSHLSKTACEILETAAIALRSRMAEARIAGEVVGWLTWPELKFIFNGTVKRIGALSVNAQPISLYAAPVPAVPTDMASTKAPQRIHGLTAPMLRTAIEFICPDGTPDQDEDELSIGVLSEHEDGPGIYAWMTEYPEEGSINLAMLAAQPAHGEKPSWDNATSRLAGAIKALEQCKLLIPPANWPAYAQQVLDLNTKEPK